MKLCGFNKILSDYYIGVVGTEKDRENKKLIDSLYNCEKWQYAYNAIVNYNNLHKKKLYITRTSFEIAQRLRMDLDIEVFPVIFSTYYGYLQKASGAWTWFMYDREGGKVGSSQKSNFFLRQKNEILVNKEIHEVELFIKVNK